MTQPWKSHSLTHHSVLVQAVTKPTSSSSFKGRRESLCLLMEELQGSRKTRGTRQVCVTIFSSVQSLSHVRSSRPYGLQHPRPPCPSPTPGACSNSCPWSRWRHPTISSSVVPFSSCPPPDKGNFGKIKSTTAVVMLFLAVKSVVPSCCWKSQMSQIFRPRSFFW